LLLFRHQTFKIEVFICAVDTNITNVHLFCQVKEVSIIPGHQPESIEQLNQTLDLLPRIEGVIVVFDSQEEVRDLFEVAAHLCVQHCVDNQPVHFLVHSLDSLQDLQVYLENSLAHALDVTVGEGPQAFVSEVHI